MELPKLYDQDNNLLVACFNKTSATYKFYWLLSIIQAVENKQFTVLKTELFARMISNAWFTVNYFNISFGKQDLIHNTVKSLHQVEGISINEDYDSVFTKIKTSSRKETQKHLWHFDKNVPHWFLSPWFPKHKKETYAERTSRIYSDSQQFANNCIYALFKDRIEINPFWHSYLIFNSKLLKEFCYWNLALFLQTKNPNVPDITGKLIKTPTRNSLVKQRKQFWDVVFKELGKIDCIYTGKQLDIDGYAVEHFIPYSFVSHDLVWNLIPADPSYNSTKSNKLPKLEDHFKPFFNLQKQAFDIISSKMPKSKLLEDYYTVLGQGQKTLNESKFKDIIAPLISIAANNGFESL